MSIKIDKKRIEQFTRIETSGDIKFDEKAMNLLGIEIRGKLSRLERMYLLLISRLLRLRIVTDRVLNLGTKNFEEEHYLEIKAPYLKDILFEEDSSIAREFEDFINYCGEITVARQIKPELILVGLPKSVIQGDFLKRAIEGKANCFEWSLAMALVAKVVYNIDAAVVPYNVESCNQTGNRLRHDHYGLFFSIDGKNYISMYPYHTHELELIQGKEVEEIYRYLREYEGKTNENDNLRWAIARHLFAIANSVV